jgi:hypothetical protein
MVGFGVLGLTPPGDVLTPLTGLEKLTHEGQTIRDSMQLRLVIACSESQTQCHRSVTVARTTPK